MNLTNQENVSDVQFYTEQGQKVSSLDINVEGTLAPGESTSLVARICFSQSGEKGFGIEVRFLANIFMTGKFQVLGKMSTTDPCQFRKNYPLSFLVHEPFTALVKAVNNEVSSGYFLSAINCLLRYLLCLLAIMHLFAVYRRRLLVRRCRHRNRSPFEATVGMYSNRL